MEYTPDRAGFHAAVTDQRLRKETEQLEARLFGPPPSPRTPEERAAIIDRAMSLRANHPAFLAVAMEKKHRDGEEARRAKEAKGNRKQRRAARRSGHQAVSS